MASTGSLLPENWSELAPMVDRLLETDPGERARLLELLSDGNRIRHDSLERLLAECERPDPLLDVPATERFDQLFGHDYEQPLPAVVAGRYRVGGRLGHGGMAVVHLAHDLESDQDVALKIIRSELAASIGRDRFHREIAIARRLDHPNIMPLLDSGEFAGRPFFIMPYHSGPTLGDLIRRDGPIRDEAAIKILFDVARAMEHAHAHGVVHRDIKPDNVMIRSGSAIVTDFGIAKAFTLAQGELDDRPITMAGTVIGTPAYMSPEQAMASPDTDHRTDIYSFGCLAHELFTGHPPFNGATSLEILAMRTGNNPMQIDPASIGAPAAIARLIVACLEVDPNRRPRSAEELLAALR